MQADDDGCDFIMDMMPYLKLMAEKGASDLFFCTGSEPQIKINGAIRPVGTKKLEPGDVSEMAASLMRLHKLIQN